MGSPAVQNTNFLLYTLEVEVNLLDFNPDYPKEPKTLGERIRKVRMDKGLMIKEVAEMLGVTEDTVINWELRGRKPRGRSLERVRKLFGILVLT
ncbi:MAG: helix-turn-helix transcriptional regulator [Candidatus Omnitrophota bacterium]